MTGKLATNPLPLKARLMTQPAERLFCERQLFENFLPFVPEILGMSYFSALGEDLVTAICVREPYTSHANLRVVSCHLKNLITSPAFREERIASGYAERGLVIAGGSRGSRMFVDGRWTKIAPIITPRIHSCLLGGDG